LDKFYYSALLYIPLVCLFNNGFQQFEINTYPVQVQTAGYVTATGIVVETVVLAKTDPYRAGAHTSWLFFLVAFGIPYS
jgi:hypothetical protein